MRNLIKAGRDFDEAAAEVAEETEMEGEMIEAFDNMSLALRKLAYQARLIVDGGLQ